LGSGWLSPAEEEKFTESLASIYAWRGAHRLAIALLSRYLDGKDKPQLQNALLASQIADRQNVVAEKSLGEKIARADKGAGLVTQADLKELAHLCYVTDKLPCYEVALERLANLDPNWTFRKDLLTGLGKKYGGSLQLELYRLESQQHPLTSPDMVLFARLLAARGAPAEAVKLVERGFNEGTLGTGRDAAHHGRLRDYVVLLLNEAKKKNYDYDIALQLKQFDKIATIGFDLVHGGETGKGLAMMSEAIASGQLKDTDLTMLRYGEALAASGQGGRAVEVLRKVQGGSGLAELARYWILQIKHPATYVSQ
jgi:hypothetical protein